ncbi:hypothetical protein JCM3774_001390 [Rhodotorula dairenensis]
MTITLPLALDRIATLERQLAHASQLLEQHTGLNLSTELVKAGLEPRAERVERGATARTGPDAEANRSPETASADAATPAAAVDLGLLILRALEIRKRVHAGSVTDEEARADLDGMVDEHKLTAEQATTLRAWAGQ